MMAKLIDINPKPVIYLHIGTNKTGTTAIQRHFEKHRQFYKTHALLYPETTNVAGAHHALSSSLGFRHTSSPEDWLMGLDDINDGLLDEINNADVSSVIFSSEMFVLNNPVEKVRQFFEGFQVNVVVYLRRHDHWWQSAYAQAVKTKALPPWPRGVRGFVNFNKNRKNGCSNYGLLLDRWSKHFGRENILVRPYEQLQNKPDIVSDLLKTIGFTCDDPQKPRLTERENESLSAYTLGLIDVFQRTQIDDVLRNQLITYAMSLPVESEKAGLISPKFRLKLVEENLADYEYIAREYLRREDGRLFYEPLPVPDPDWQVPVQATRMQIVEATLAAMTEKFY